MKYKAFISYRHCELDSEAAKKIIKSVESYGIPKTIAEKHHIEKHVGKLFRDEDELAAADDLSVVITEALDESEYFIMVCSPRYIESEWCMLELQHWINRNGRKNIIAVLTEGEPYEAFPKILTDYTENGKPVHIDPLAVDIRGASQKEVLRNIDIQKFRIISSLIGCDYDDLRQRQQERAKRNTAGIFGGVLSVFALIAAIILASNIKLNEKNIELEELHGSLEQAQAELDVKNSEIEARATSLAELNISIVNKMADMNMLVENSAAASAEKLLAYKKSKETGVSTADTFNGLIEYSDLYNTDLAKKIKRTTVDAPIDCGNSRYFKADDFYDVFKNEPIYYTDGNDSYTLAEYLPLEGSKFASVYFGSDYSDTLFELTVRILDISDGSEKEYKYAFEEKEYIFLEDCFTDNGELVVVTKYHDEDGDKVYNIFVFDYNCHLKNQYTLTAGYLYSGFYLLSSEIFLDKDGIYNFATGERTEFENTYFNNYGFRKHSKKNAVYTEYDYESDSYVFSERNYQFDYVAVFGDYYIYNYDNLDSDGLRKANIYRYNMKTNKADSLYNEDIDIWKLRFSVSDSGSILAYTDGSKITVVNKNEVYNTRDCLENVRKLAVSDNYLIVLYYDQNPQVIYFDYETMDFTAESQLEINYDDVILCGNVLHMYSSSEGFVDTYYLNDFNGYKAVTVPPEEVEKYKYMNHNAYYSVSDDFAILFYNVEREYVTPMLCIFDANNGSLLGNFEVSDEFAGRYVSSSGRIRYECPYVHAVGFIEGDYYENDNKEMFISYLVNYKGLLNSNDSVESHIIDINYYADSTVDNISCITQWHSDGTDFENIYGKKDHGTFSGAVYDMAEGKLIEEVNFFDKRTTGFYIYKNIRVESGDYGIRIYDGGKLINSFDSKRFYTYKNPDLIVTFDNDRWVIFSLSQNKELFSVESDKKISRHTFSTSEDGSFILFEYRYLVDTEKFEIIHDFGENSPVSRTSHFMFNEHLGLWEFMIVGRTEEVIFCYPDTFEVAFSVDDIVIQSPNGKYFYILDGGYLKSSDESRALWQIPLLKEDEAIEKVEKMLSDLGITEEEIEELSVISSR